MSYKSNVDIVIKGLETKSEKIVNALMLGARAGAEDYLGRAKQKFMSGRPGLRAPTGTLRRSWRAKARRIDENDILISVSTGVKYAAVHEYGSQNVPAHTRTSRKGKTYQVRAHRKTYPQRLRMRRTWQRPGANLIAKRAAKYAIRAGRS